MKKEEKKPIEHLKRNSKKKKHKHKSWKVMMVENTKKFKCKTSLDALYD
jgi:hypothetical protein